MTKKQNYKRLKKMNIADLKEELNDMKLLLAEEKIYLKEMREDLSYRKDFVSHMTEDYRTIKKVIKEKNDKTKS